MVTTLVVKSLPCHHLYWHLRCASYLRAPPLMCGVENRLTQSHSCLQPVCTGCAVCRCTTSQTTPKHDMANSSCSDGSFWHAPPCVRATMVTKKQMLPGRNCQFRWDFGVFSWELTRYVVSILHRLFTNTGILLKKLSLFERWTDEAFQQTSPSDSKNHTVPKEVTALSLWTLNLVFLDFKTFSVLVVSLAF